MAFVLSFPIPIPIPMPVFQCRGLQMAVANSGKYKKGRGSIGNWKALMGLY